MTSQELLKVPQTLLVCFILKNAVALIFVCDGICALLLSSSPGVRLCSWCDLSLLWADRGRHNRTPTNNRKSNFTPWAISLFTEISSACLPKQTLSQTIASIRSLVDDGPVIQNTAAVPQGISSLFHLCVCVCQTLTHAHLTIFFHKASFCLKERQKVDKGRD